MKQLALELSTAPPPSLDNFEPAGNTLLWATLQAGLSQLSAGASPQPLLLWGASGAGKTHLLQGLQAWGDDRAWPWAVLHAASDADLALDFDPAWRLLLMDDVDLWSAPIQARAFQWLASTQGHVQRPWVVATASTPPTDWTAMRADVSSRLAQGLVLEIQLLDEAARLGVLRREAEARGLHLSDEVASFMLRRFSRDLGSLMALLAHVDDYAMRSQRALTVPLLKSMLENE